MKYHKMSVISIYKRWINRRKRDKIFKRYVRVIEIICREHIYEWKYAEFRLSLNEIPNASDSTSKHRQ